MAESEAKKAKKAREKPGKALTREKASRRKRSFWEHGAVTSGLTPEGLSQILQDADDGEPDEFLQLAAEMERRDPHYLGQLSIFKTALPGLEWGVAKDSEQDADPVISE